MEGLSDDEVQALWAPLMDKPASVVVASLATMLATAIIHLAADRSDADEWQMRAMGCVQTCVAGCWELVRGAPARRGRAGLH